MPIKPITGVRENTQARLQAQLLTETQMLRRGLVLDLAIAGGVYRPSQTEEHQGLIHGLQA